MDRLLDLFRPGRRIHIPGASGEILAMAAVLAADPGRLAGVELTSCLLPGFNSFDYAALDPTARLDTFLLPPALRGSFDAGNTRLIPLPYSAIARHIERGGFDVGFFHVARPDENGQCSLGIAADFAIHAWRTAQYRVLVVNPAMPAMSVGSHLDRADADLVVEIESPLVTAADTPADPAADAVARHVADLVPDGATVQMGIGGVPGAMWATLSGHRDLTIASGMVTDGWRTLRQAGAVRAGPHHRAGVMLGDRALYDDLADQDWLRLAPVGETHDAQMLGKIECFVAINSALEVDLFGQANLEWRDGKPISGVGGALDFAQGGIRSPRGRSVLALPATARGGSVSRIVPRLSAPTVSLARDHVDTVVTEFGVAELRGRSLAARATALIDVAAPAYRETLSAAWRTMLATL